jgi:uncharacterized delta-60 repeat protein
MNASRAAIVLAAAALVVAGVPAAAPGDLDPSFGDGGIVISKIRRNSYALALVIQPDQKLVAAGTSDVSDACEELTLARYRPNGSLDPTFGTGGHAVVPSCGYQRGRAVALQDDGKLVLAGGEAYGDNGAVVRFTPDGILDTTFGDDGIVHVPGINVYAVATQRDGKVVAGGVALHDRVRTFALLRLHRDGSVDTSFGDDGTVVVPFAAAAVGLVVQEDDRIVGAGWSGDFTLARFKPSGKLDRRFGVDGIVRTRIGNHGSTAEALALQPDGKLVAAGWAGGYQYRGTRFALARYQPDGRLDRSFGGDGTILTRLGGAHAVALQLDGKVVAAGYDLNMDFALVRYRTDGRLDPTFGQGGKVITPLYGAVEGLVVQRDGKVVAGGWTAEYEYRFALARYRG